MPPKKNNYTFKGILDTDKYSYKISIDTSQRTINGEVVVYSRYFNFGIYTSDTGEKKSCVDIYVVYPALKLEDNFANYTLAKLITTHHNEKCSVDEKLERGDGTRHMINTAMYFVLKMCPFVEGFEINDASTRNCDNNTIITLSYFSIVQYNKTWYEKNFNAFIDDAKKREGYYNIINKLKNNELPQWDTFLVQYLRGVNKDIVESLHDIYKSSRTYNNLFQGICKLGPSMACILIQPWIDKLMLTTSLNNYILFTQWIIPRDSIKTIKLLNYKKDFYGNVENYTEMMF